ncbi:MAG: tetratricopeptide repeat protein, partial [Solimonas sp.]
QKLRVRLERLRQRRPWLVAIAALLVLSLAVSTLLWRRAERAHEDAALEAAQAQAVNSFLTDDLLANADPLQAGRRDLQVSELLGQASMRAAARFAGRPEVEAAVREAIGKAYGGLSDYEASARELRRAIELLDGQAGSRQRQDELRLDLIWLALTTEHLDEADTQIAVLAAQPPQWETGLLQLATVQAWRRFRKGEYEPALAALDAQRPQYEALLKNRPALAEAFLLHLGDAYNAAERYADAVVLFQQLLDYDARIYGRRDARALDAMQALGAALAFTDRNDEALKVLEEADAIAHETLGPEHDLSLQVAGELAGVYDNLGREDEAMALYEKVLETRLRRFGENDLDARTMMANLSVVYGNLHRYEDSLALQRRLYAIELREGGESHPRTLLTALNLSFDLASLKRWDEAARVQVRTLALARKALPADDEHLGIVQYKLAQSLGELGRIDESRANFDEAIAFFKRTLGDDARLTRRAMALREELTERKKP